jgi:HEAT repeat protein
MKQLRAELVTTLKNSLVRIIDSDNNTTLGTGFFCSPEGHVLTCSHVVKDITHQIKMLSFSSDKKFIVYPKDIFIDDAGDVAIISTLEKSFPWLMVDVHQRTKHNDQCVLVGFPKGSEFEKSSLDYSGNFGEETRIENTPVRRLEGVLSAIKDGVSGAPVLNKRTGKVVGPFKGDLNEQVGFATLPHLQLEHLGIVAHHEVPAAILGAVAREADSALKESLKGTQYIHLRLEQGHLPQKKEGRADEMASVEQRQDGRTWSDFDLGGYLKKPLGVHLLSSSVGAGKTCFHAWLCREAVLSGFLPLRFHCRELEAIGLEKLTWESVSDFWLKMMVERLGKPKEDLCFCIDHFKDKNKILLVADGLDQIEGHNYSLLVDHLTKRLPNTPLFITGRPSAMQHWLNQPEITYLRLRPMDDDMQRQFFGEYYEKTREIFFLSPQLLREPMLAFMVRDLASRDVLGDIRTRAELYRKFINHIISSHPPNRVCFSSLSDKAYEIITCLENIAFISLDAKPPHIQHVPHNVARDSLLPGIQVQDLPVYGFVNYVIEVGKDASKSLLFTHQSFQEFLAARYLAKDKNREVLTRVLEESWNPKWRESILFLAGLLGQEIPKKLFSNPEDDDILHSHLFLAAACCAEIEQIDPDYDELLNQQMVAMIDDPLFSDIALKSLAQNSAQYLFKTPQNDLTRTKDVANSCIIELSPATQYKILNAYIHLHCDEAKEVTSHLPWAAIKSEHVSALIERLMDEDPWERRTAARTLGHIGGALETGHVSALAERLRDDDPGLRRATVEALGMIGSALKPEHVSALAERLWDDDPGVRGVAVQAFGKIDSSLVLEHVVALAERLRDDDPDVSGAATWFLEDFVNALETEHVSALIERLMDEDPRKRRAAAQVLGHIGGALEPEHVFALSERLRDDDPGLRRATVEALGMIGSALKPEHVSALAERLWDDDPGVREVAVQALGMIESSLKTEHVFALIERLGDDDPEVHWAAIQVLRDIGGALETEHVSAFAERLWDDDPGVRVVAARALGHIGGALETGHVSALSERLGDDNPKVRRATVEAFGMIGSALKPEHVSALAERLGDDNPEVRRSAVKTLGDIGSSLEPEHVFELIERLWDDDLNVRWSAGEALGKIENALEPEHVFELIERLGDDNPEVRRSAVEVLEKIGSALKAEHVFALIERLGDDNPEARRATVEALGMIGSALKPEHVSALAERLGDDDPGVRGTTVFALGKIESSLKTEHISALIERLKDEHPGVRFATVWVLGDIGSSLKTEHAPALIERLKDEHPHVRWMAVEAFGNIRSALKPEHVSALAERLGDDDPEVRESAVKALGDIGSALEPEHVFALIERLGDDNLEVRRSAVKAFGKIGSSLKTEHVSTLAERLKDDHPDVRRAAVYALEKIGSALEAKQLQFLSSRFLYLDTESRYIILRIIRRNAIRINLNTTTNLIRLMLSNDNAQYSQNLLKCLKAIYESGIHSWLFTNHKKDKL